MGWNELSKKATIPEIDATTTETPEQVAIDQPSKFIQPITNAVNLLNFFGARMKTKWYCPFLNERVQRNGFHENISLTYAGGRKTRGNFG